MRLRIQTSLLVLFSCCIWASSHGSPAALQPGADPSCPYETLGMLEKYEGEETPGGYYTTAVPYLNEEQRKNYQVFVQEGLLVDAQGHLVDAHRASMMGSDLISLQAIYVMDACGRIFMTYHHEVGLFHHSSFLSGGPISAAGEMLVVDGRILEIDSASGHYRPPPQATEQLVHRLRILGADLSMATLNF